MNTKHKTILATAIVALVALGILLLPWVLAFILNDYVAAHAWYCHINGMQFGFSTNPDADHVRYCL